MVIDRVIKICEILDIDVKIFNFLNIENNENSLFKEEIILLENYNKLNVLGKDKLLEYSNDLIEILKYIDIKENNVIELIIVIKEEF